MEMNCLSKENGSNWLAEKAKGKAFGKTLIECLELAGRRLQKTDKGIYIIRPV